VGWFSGWFNGGRIVEQPDSAAPITSTASHLK
jgi:hypothetical protein